MQAIFSGCSSLKVLDLSNFNTNNVTDMSYMFNKCTSLITLPTSYEWVNKYVRDTSYMFYGCSSLISLPDASNLHKERIQKMSCMFDGCSSLKSLPVIHISNEFKKRESSMGSCKCSSSRCCSRSSC